MFDDIDELITKMEQREPAAHVKVASAKPSSASDLINRLDEALNSPQLSSGDSAGKIAIAKLLAAADLLRQ